MSAKTVLLTGASGFIALHITDRLLDKGYTVVGTVRSQSQADDLSQKYIQLYPNGKLSYEIVADISKPNAFDEVFKKHPEIDYVLHTASPFSFGLDKPLDEGYLYPAVDGTKNALTAAKEYGPNVKQVVVTSSFAAIVNNDKITDSSFIHTEKVWNPIEWKDVKDEVDAYFASKKLAEKAAWDFVKEESPKFALTTVTPPYVFGVQFFEDSLKNATLNTSSEIINQTLNTPVNDSTLKDQPRYLAVDVKDVAKIHVAALENPKLQGERLFPNSGAFSTQYFLDVIHANFPEVKDKVGKGDPSKTKEHLYNDVAKADSSATLKLLGWESFTPLEDTVVEAVKQILDYRKKN